MNPINDTNPGLYFMSAIRHAVLGNLATWITFRVGAEDAPFLAPDLEPVFDSHDLLTLQDHVIYLKLMIDGTPIRPFSVSIRQSQMPADLGALGTRK